jgi:putative ABC transport system permease protein
MLQTANASSARVSAATIVRRGAGNLFRRFGKRYDVSPLCLTLAVQNLFYDRWRFIATIIGIVFSIVLVTVQMGLFVSFSQMVATAIDHAPADLWIVPQGTRCFEDPAPLDDSERFRALSVKGVADAVSVVVGFAEWQAPGGKKTGVFMIGSPLERPGLTAWNLVAGSVRALAIPDAVAIDQSYFGELKSKGLLDTAEINGRRAQVRAVTKGIRSFTTMPIVFAPLNRAQSYMEMAPSKITFVLVHLAPGAALSDVRARLQQALSKVEVLTPAEFASRSRSFWLFGTGAGAGLFFGALLGLIVGTVIVGQTLYSATMDNLYEFAVLRAMGSSAAYINTIIIIQALISAVIGFSIAAAVGLAIMAATADTALPVLMTPGLTVILFVITVGMCVLSAVSAIVKVMRMDPAMLFAR